MIALKRNDTLYQQIATYFETEIREGRLKPGVKLPPTTELSRQFGVNPDTIQQSLRILMNQGLISRAPKRGTFVRGSYHGNTIGIVFGKEIFKAYFLDNQICCRLWGNLLKADLVKRHQPSGNPHCTNEDFLRMTYLMYYADSLLYIRKRAYRYHYGTGAFGKKIYTLNQFRQFANNMETFRELAVFFRNIPLSAEYHESLKKKMQESCLYTLEILHRLPTDQLVQGMNLLFEIWEKEELCKTLLLQHAKIANSIPGRIRAALCILYDVLKYYIPSLGNRLEWRKNR